MAGGMQSTRDLGPGTWDLGPGTCDLGPGTWDLGPGTWDLACETWDLGPGNRDLGPGTWDLRPSDLVPGTTVTWDPGWSLWLEFSSWAGWCVAEGVRVGRVL